MGVWVIVVVKALRYKSEGPGIDPLCRRDFSRGIWQIYVHWGRLSLQKWVPVYLWGKGGRNVRLTTYHLHVPIVKKSGGLNLLESCGPVQVCNGIALRFIQMWCK